MLKLPKISNKYVTFDKSAIQQFLNTTVQSTFIDYTFEVKASHTTNSLYVTIVGPYSNDRCGLIRISDHFCKNAKITTYIAQDNYISTNVLIRTIKNKIKNMSRAYIHTELEKLSQEVSLCL